MADVRSLLRAERASRRITHPHASYTGDGKLLCNLCETFVKSEAQWQSHLHSTQHVLRSQRMKDAGQVKGKGSKRKAESEEDEEDVEVGRKRAKAEDGEDGNRVDMRPKKVVKFRDVEESAEEPASEEVQPMSNGKQSPTSREQDAAVKEERRAQQDTVDEAEFLAFEREIAALDQASQSNSALNAEATISAPALTAEQLATQASEEQSTQRGKRDVELEEEKEDAARVLEEEFEEMRGLEERVRKLRERREALRRPSGGQGIADDGATAIPASGDAVVNGAAEEDDDDEGDDDEEEDGWAFGGVG